MLTISKRLRTLMASALVVAGALAASTAAAAPQFTVNPNADGLSSSGTPFTADTLDGTSSARITRDGATNNYTGVGYIVFTAFNLNSSPIDAGTTQVNLNNSGYGLYATFTQHFSCGGPLAIGVTCGVTSISLSLYGDPGNHDTKQLATVATGPSVTDVGSTDVLLASVNQVVAGVAGLNALGGVFENINTDFALTPAGSNYFTSPVPFYQLAFSAFSNSTQGIACDTAGCTGNPSVVAINSESGVVDFNRVPEPGPLALMGIALLGLIVARRRYRA